MTLTYACSRGHLIVRPANQPLDRCPAYVLGVACDGDLRRVGPGSRKREKASS